MITVEQDREELQRTVTRALQLARVNSLLFAIHIVRLELTASGPADKRQLCHALTVQANPDYLDAALAVLMLNDEVEQIEEDDSSFYQMTA